MQSSNEPKYGRRTVEELQSQVQEELERLKEKDREVEDLHQRVRESFKTGARRLCAIDIWRFIAMAAAAKNQAKLAKRFSISESVVTNGLKYGALSLDNLVVILTELSREFNDIPNMPSREARAVSGYQQAMRLLVFSGKDGQTITDEEFYCLRSVYSEMRSWQLANEKAIANSADAHAQALLAKLTARLNASAEKAIGRKLVFLSPDDYRRLIATWGEAYLSCIDIVSYQWIGGPRGS